MKRDLLKEMGGSGSYREIPEATRIYRKLASEFKFDQEKALKMSKTSAIARYDGGKTAVLYSKTSSEDVQRLLLEEVAPEMREKVYKIKERAVIMEEKARKAFEEYLKRTREGYSPPKSWKVEGICSDFREEFIKRLKKKGLYAVPVSTDRTIIKKKNFSVEIGHAGVLVAEHDKDGHVTSVAIYEAIRMDGKAPGFVQLRKLKPGDRISPLSFVID
jgi:hypothetical protein